MDEGCDQEKITLKKKDNPENVTAEVGKNKTTHSGE
jgi:hypothetical protein